MAKIILGPQIGEIVNDGKVVEKNYIIWCELCLKKRVRNLADKSKETRDAFDKCEMRDWETVDRDGLITKGKLCRHCNQIVVTYKELKDESN